MNRVGQAGTRREHLARLLPARRARPTSRRCATRGGRPSRGRALPRRGARASRPRSSGRGTASGTGAATTTTARRSDRRRTTSAASTRSRSRGRCSRAPCRTRFAERAMDAVRTSLVARRSQIAAAARPAVRPLGAGPGLHQGLPARRPRERRPVHARRGLGRDGAGAARQRRRGRRAVPHAEPGQPHAARRPDVDALQGRAVRRWPATSTRARRTPGAAAGPGTPARPAGCIAPASRASSACGAAGHASARSLHPLVVARVRRSSGASARRATRSRCEPGAPLPRRRVGVIGWPRGPAGRHPAPSRRRDAPGTNRAGRWDEPRSMNWRKNRGSL